MHQGCKQRPRRQKENKEKKEENKIFCFSLLLKTSIKSVEVELPSSIDLLAYSKTFFSFNLIDLSIKIIFVL